MGLITLPPLAAYVHLSELAKLGIRAIIFFGANSDTVVYCLNLSLSAPVIVCFGLP